MRGASKAVVVLIAALSLVTGIPSMASAHDEREPLMPDGSGSVPIYRTDGPRLLVCKTDKADFDRRIAGFEAALRQRNEQLFTECQQNGYRHLQEAVNNVQQPGTNIYLLPGVYREEPSLAAPTATCANLPARTASLGYQVLTYEQQLACPHNQNLVAVLGAGNDALRNLQIEGTGASPTDVILDAQYTRLNALRVDRADGIYLRNFTAQRTTFNAIYILETDGFVIDRAVGRWNDEYGFLTFATDHGLYTDCEAYGNGDSGLYPGAAHNINAGRGHNVERYAIEIRRCKSHHNLLGYSGTGGDSVYMHDSELYENTAGVSMDSAFPGHPGLPQNHVKLERNRIHDNNVDYYDHIRDGTCAKPYAERGYEKGVVCPAVGVPLGTGVLTAGGNHNVFRDNWVWGHRNAAFMLFWVPAYVRGDKAVSKQADTSHDNRYEGNHLGVTPDGARRPNGRDFWWDGQGTGNCWQGGRDGSEPVAMPGCGSTLGSTRFVSEPTKLVKLYLCSEFDQRARRIPAGCDWYGASGLARTEIKLGLLDATIGVLMGLLALFVLRRRPATGIDPRVTVAAIAAGALGVVLGVPWPAIGLLLTGGWWLAAGVLLRASGLRGPGWLAITLGAISILDSFDRIVLILPLLPVPPAWLRVLLTAALAGWLAVLAARSWRRRTSDRVILNTVAADA